MFDPAVAPLATVRASSSGAFPTMARMPASWRSANGCCWRETSIRPSANGTNMVGSERSLSAAFRPWSGRRLHRHWPAASGVGGRDLIAGRSMVIGDDEGDLGPYASPPYFLHELDEAYLGFPRPSVPQSGACAEGCSPSGHSLPMLTFQAGSLTRSVTRGGTATSRPSGPHRWRQRTRMPSCGAWTCLITDITGRLTKPGRHYGEQPEGNCGTQPPARPHSPGGHRRETAGVQA